MRGGKRSSGGSENVSQAASRPGGRIPDYAGRNKPDMDTDHTNLIKTETIHEELTGPLYLDILMTQFVNTESSQLDVKEQNMSSFSNKACFLNHSELIFRPHFCDTGLHKRF